MNWKRTALLGAMLCLALATTGCITTTTVPGRVMTGDLLQIGLGGVKRNSTGKALTASDLAVTIEDSAMVTHNVKVVGLFRAFPDYTSWYARDSLNRQDFVFGEVEPYDGMWWTTLRLVAPGSGDTPLPLAVGPATITITSTELINTGWSEEGDLTSFPVEVLAGVRVPTEAELRQYSAYRHQVALRIDPDTLSGVSVVGGLQVKLTYNTSAILAAGVSPRVVPISHDPNISIIQGTVNNGDGTETVTAMITNPNGFVPNADSGGSWVIGNSTFDDLQFAVVMQDNTNLADGWPSNYWLEPSESYYIDDNGNVIGAITPVLSRTINP